jgi:hypothetical protein
MPGIHVLTPSRKEDVDGRVKPGHDEPRAQVTLARSDPADKKKGAPSGAPLSVAQVTLAAYDAAARGARFLELRWKNSAWLATAETIAGWNGFEIRNAGSGRSPVRKRSG